MPWDRADDRITLPCYADAPKFHGSGAAEHGTAAGMGVTNTNNAFHFFISL
jgi:hypothetical protein